jgi:hypothetical protein
LKIFVLTYLTNSNKAKEYESFSSAPEESNDTSDTAQLLIVIPGKREYFEVVE